VPSLPKLIFDTNVCGKLLTSSYRGDLEGINRRLSRNFRVVISFVTFIELLDGIKGGDATHFESDKQRLRFMAGGGRPTFLRLPGAFALSKVLGIEPAHLRSVSKLGPADFQKWFCLILRAEGRDEMLRSGVKHPLAQRQLAAGFDPANITREQRAAKTAHRRILEDVRDGKRPSPSPDVWAAGIALALGRRIQQSQATLLANRLDAAYQYRKAMCDVAATGSYNFDKHDGDWNDYQQLFYLCDPSIHLLTDDAKLRKRVVKSPQRDRILDLRDFLKSLGFTPCH
jgi:hypothetical protein